MRWKWLWRLVYTVHIKVLSRQSDLKSFSFIVIAEPKTIFMITVTSFRRIQGQLNCEFIVQCLSGNFSLVKIIICIRPTLPTIMSESNSCIDTILGLYYTMRVWWFRESRPLRWASIVFGPVLHVQFKSSHSVFWCLCSCVPSTNEFRLFNVY